MPLPSSMRRARTASPRVAGDGAEPADGVVDAALVVGDRPLLVVGAGLPVVVEHVGQLGILPRRLDLLGRGMRIRHMGIRGMGIPSMGTRNMRIRGRITCQ